MKVDKLHVIVLRAENSKDKGLVEEAKALAKRSIILGKTRSVAIHDYILGHSGSAPEKWCPDTKYYGAMSIVPGRGTVGAYVIGHGSNFGMDCLPDNGLTGMLRGCGINKLDKLSFVSCEVGKRNFLYEDEVTDKAHANFVARSCDNLGRENVGNGPDGKIMAAGWTTYVTLAYPGRKSETALGKKTAKNEKWDILDHESKDLDALKKDLLNKDKGLKSGRKYAKDQGIKYPVYLLRKKNPHMDLKKVFFAWDKRKGLRTIQEPEWTDNNNFKD